MKWQKEALKRLEAVPVPPIMARYAKLDAEMRSRRKGLAEVTEDIVVETEKGYQQTFGAEAVQTINDMAEGKDAGLPDEFYEEDGDELYTINLCPAKYGACTANKRELMRAVLNPLRARLKELNVTRIIMDKSHPPLMSHHSFTISLIGCPNCCMSPYFSDFGIICLYRPAVNTAECIQCGACVDYCTEKAIIIASGELVIDYQKCVRCGGCVKECPVNALSIDEKSYKVVVGGCGSRHPQIAKTVTECTDGAGVLKILEKTLKLYQEIPDEGREISFHEVIRRYGIERLTLKKGG
jgi:dissimilatory sulfite reductase (desulfoviridin) alpha/beta subunit